MNLYMVLLIRGWNSLPGLRAAYVCLFGRGYVYFGGIPF